MQYKKCIYEERWEEGGLWIKIMIQMFGWWIYKRHQKEEGDNHTWWLKFDTYKIMTRILTITSLRHSETI